MKPKIYILPDKLVVFYPDRETVIDYLYNIVCTIDHICDREWVKIAMDSVLMYLTLDNPDLAIVKPDEITSETFKIALINLIEFITREDIVEKIGRELRESK